MSVLIYSLDRKFHFKRGCAAEESVFLGKGFPIWVHKAKPCELCAERMDVFISDNGEAYHLKRSCVQGHTLKRKSFGEIHKFKYRPCSRCADDINLLNLWQISVESWGMK